MTAHVLGELAMDDEGAGRSKLKQQKTEDQKFQMVTAGNNTNDEERRHPAKRRLTTFEELNARVDDLTATKKELEATLEAS